MKINRLILFVTAQCDSKCIMCFNYNLNADIRKELTLEEYKKIAKNLKSKLKSLIISGGEPSLRKDLPEICKSFYDYCNMQRIELPLNGHNKERIVELTEKILKSCPIAQLDVRLSIDGIGKIHDIQRGVNGSFDKVMSTHEALFNLSKRYNNLKRGLTTTITTTNINNIEELVNYIYALSSQPDYHDFMACRIQADSKIDTKLLINLDEYKKILNIINKYAYFYSKKRYGGFILGSAGYIRNRLLNYVYLNAYGGREIIRCRAPEFIRVIEADGRMRICELKEAVGNIRDYNYDLNEVDKILNLSSMEMNCACTHPCFIAPSIGYPMNLFRCLKSLLFDIVRFRRIIW